MRFSSASASWSATERALELELELERAAELEWALGLLLVEEDFVNLVEVVC
jgi:hypothetical protein